MMYVWPEDATIPDCVPRAVSTFGVDIVAKGLELAHHHHRKAQLLFTKKGVVTCWAAGGIWIVPPGCSVWIPSNLPHRIEGAGDIRVYCLFVEPNAVRGLPRECCTLTMSPLLCELIVRSSQISELYDVNGPEGRIINVLLDELITAPVAQLHFPMPTDKRLRHIAAAMVENPADRATISQWAKRVATSERTLTRILHRETGMSFGHWRRQLDITLALQRLADGVPVQIIASDLGYEGTSSFIAMFRKALGKSPGGYFSRQKSTDSRPQLNAPFKRLT